MNRAIKALDEIILLLKGKDVYLGIVEELNYALSVEWDSLRIVAIKQAIEFFYNFEGEPNSEEAKGIMQNLNRILGTAYAARVGTMLNDIHTKTYEYGLGDNKKLKIKTQFNQTSTRVLNWLHDNHTYWLGNFFSNQISERLERDLNGLFVDIAVAGYGREKAGQYLKDRLNGLFDKPEGYKGTVDNYFQGVATNFITQTREFAHIDAYERAEIEYVTVDAVLDHRTSEICKHMHGTVIPLKHLKSQREKILAAKSPEEAKKYSWWPKNNEIADINTLKLPAKIGLPPYHFFCRTTTRPSSQLEIDNYLLSKK